MIKNKLLQVRRMIKYVNNVNQNLIKKLFNYNNKQLSLKLKIKNYKTK